MIFLLPRFSIANILYNCLFSVFQEEKMSLTVPDAVDYKGYPADRAKTGGWVPAALILGLFICLISLLIF